MYTDSSCRIKFTAGLSESFISDCGVKQGDVLSPLLFNFYINDLVKEFGDSIIDPVKIGDVSLNILLYADDIPVVLISESKDGLQNCLKTLSDYCTAWQLEVNTNKSKILVFNSNGKSFLNEFVYNGINLQTVKQYCYI